MPDQSLKYHFGVFFMALGRDFDQGGTVKPKKKAIEEKVVLLYQT